jgi:hypothetical protein
LLLLTLKQRGCFVYAIVADALYFYKNKGMYEHKKQKLAPKKVYYQRLWKNVTFGMGIMLICLLIGVIGYKLTIPEFDWFDSLLNASMILSGMGPIIEPSIKLTDTAKLFASAYALFSGVAFISTIGILIAPVVHRFFHKLHLEDDSQP